MKASELYYESFELSQHIAGGCTFQLTLGEESCRAEGLGFGEYFFTTVKVCNGSIIRPEEYCYTTGGGLVVLMNS
jgi:hypothetical protein